MLIAPLHIVDYLWVFPMVGIGLVVAVYAWLKAPSGAAREQRNDRDEAVD